MGKHTPRKTKGSDRSRAASNVEPHFTDPHENRAARTAARAAKKKKEEKEKEENKD